MQDVAVLVDLDRGEQRAKGDGQDQGELGALAVALLQSVVRPGDGGAREQQRQGVDQRQVPGGNQLDALGRPGGPGVAHFGDGRERAVLVEQGHLEEDPEPRHEEHHFRSDEHDHAVAEADGDHRGMVTLVGFLDHVGPPQGGDPQQTDQAGREEPPLALLDAQGALHPSHEAHEQHGGRHRGQQGPRARVHQVVVVLHALGHEPLSSPRSPRAGPVDEYARAIASPPRFRQGAEPLQRASLAQFFGSFPPPPWSLRPRRWGRRCRTG